MAKWIPGTDTVHANRAFLRRSVPSLRDLRRVRRVVFYAEEFREPVTRLRDFRHTKKWYRAKVSFRESDRRTGHHKNFRTARGQISHM